MKSFVFANQKAIDQALNMKSRFYTREDLFIKTRFNTTTEHGKVFNMNLFLEEQNLLSQTI